MLSQVGTPCFGLSAGAGLIGNAVEHQIAAGVYMVVSREDNVNAVCIHQLFKTGFHIVFVIKGCPEFESPYIEKLPGQNSPSDSQIYLRYEWSLMLLDAL